MQYPIYKIMVAVVFVMAIFAFYDNGDAMQQCQQKNSYETCFYLLNR